MHYCFCNKLHAGMQINMWLFANGYYSNINLTFNYLSITLCISGNKIHMSFSYTKIIFSKMNNGIL